MSDGKYAWGGKPKSQPTVPVHVEAYTWTVNVGKVGENLEPATARDRAILLEVLGTDQIRVDDYHQRHEDLLAAQVKMVVFE